MGQTEEKKAGKIRFNLIDLVLIIAVLSCVVGIYLRYNAADKFGVNHELDSFTVSFEIENIRYTSADAFHEGDLFYLDEKNQTLGNLIAIDSTAPSKTVYIDSKGNYKTLYYPEDSRIDLTGRVLAEGIMTERGFLLGGNTYLAPGETYYVETPYINVNITVTAIEDNASAG